MTFPTSYLFLKKESQLQWLCAYFYQIRQIGVQLYCQSFQQRESAPIKG